ncbi:unnamed protein product [Moritella viscosa]|nr:unnamed protein product [Moritella viscosa]
MCDLIKLITLRVQIKGSRKRRLAMNKRQSGLACDGVSG